MGVDPSTENVLAGKTKGPQLAISRAAGGDGER
jgi:hypothetical protein